MSEEDKKKDKFREDVGRKSNYNLDYGEDSVVDMSVHDHDDDYHEDLVSGKSLPIKMKDRARMELEDSGVVFYEAGEEDILQKVDLPEGWKINKTENPEFHELVDDIGEKRATIFYRGPKEEGKAELKID